MKGRFIPPSAIVESTPAYEVIESYPDDKYLPSYLVYTQERGEPLHVLFAVDIPERNVRIVTAYRPNLDDWEADLRTRRKDP